MEQKPIPFLHNDVRDLDVRLAEARLAVAPDASIFVPVEAVYSMDGDLAPLTEICNVAQKYGACVIVEEAHR